MTVSEYQLPLSTWRDGSTKRSIIDFIRAVTEPDSDYFVPVSDRIAVFDHDGTLWVEKPVMAQLAFIKSRLFELSNNSSKQEQASLFARIKETVDEFLLELIDDLAELSKDLHDGLSTDEYRDWVLKWMQTAVHPRFKCHYNELTYLPMQQLLALLKQNQFQCYIVTGGSSDFIRPWSEATYQIPPQKILGSSLRTHLAERSGRLEVQYLPVPFVLDNGEAKVKAIHRVIGKQPIIAFGNSSGDIEMLRWTGQARHSLVALVHHTDGEREYLYSPDTKYHFGKRTLAIAVENDWHVIDMKKDWLDIFSE